MTTSMVLQQVSENCAMNAILIIGLIAGLVLWFEFVLRRWSWLPRKRHARTFYEHF